MFRWRKVSIVCDRTIYHSGNIAWKEVTGIGKWWACGKEFIQVYEVERYRLKCNLDITNIDFNGSICKVLLFAIKESATIKSGNESSPNKFDN